MVEAEGERLDGRRSAKRALLVSPPPRGAECPKPVPRAMLGRERPKPRAPTSTVPI